MKIVALVLAGGEGTRLYPLTAEHAKPALAFANGYRIVDFVLSNLVNSKLSTIYMLAQYKPESLIRHVATAWAPWFGIMSTQADGLVREFREKPQRATPMPHNPARAYASMGNYLFDPAVLETALIEARSRGDTDFGRDILPRLCHQARVYAYDFADNNVPGV